MDFSDKIFADNLIPVFSEKGRKDYIIFDGGSRGIKGQYPLISYGIDIPINYRLIHSPYLSTEL